jgi:hypothetical protein
MQLQGTATAIASDQAAGPDDRAPGRLCWECHAGPIVRIDGVGPGRMEDEVDGTDRLVQGMRDCEPRLHDGRIEIALTPTCARP